jgi:hypothetical protein
MAILPQDCRLLFVRTEQDADRAFAGRLILAPISTERSTPRSDGTLEVLDLSTLPIRSLLSDFRRQFRFQAPAAPVDAYPTAGLSAVISRGPDTCRLVRRPDGKGTVEA